jgi:hypothetical protein
LRQTKIIKGDNKKEWAKTRFSLLELDHRTPPLATGRSPPFSLCSTSTLFSARPLDLNFRWLFSSSSEVTLLSPLFSISGD